MFIRTERLFLRPVFPEDWRAVFRGMSDGQVPRMIASAPFPYTVEAAIDYCRSAAGRNAYALSITVPDGEGAPLIGQIGLGRPLAPARDGSTHELGFWIAPDWRRRGYASEAAAGLLGAARALGVRRVISGHFLDNPASGRVLRRVGFAEAGEITAIASKGRGGMLVPTRRYALDLQADAMAALRPAVDQMA